MAVSTTSSKTQPLAVELIDPRRMGDSYVEAWDDLSKRAITSRPMFSVAWVRAFLACADESTSAACAFAWRGSQLVGVLPLVRRTPRSLNSTTDMLNTLSAGPLLDPAAPADVWSAMLAAHFEAYPRITSVRIQGVVRGDSLDQVIGNGCTRRPSGFVGARIRTQEPFDALHERIDAETRTHLDASGQTLSAMGPLTYESRLGTDALAFVSEFLALEASDPNGPAHSDAADATITPFYDALIKRLTDAGALRIDVLRMGEKAIAAQLSIHHRGRLYLQKIAFVEQLAKHSPGHVLWAHCIQAACADQDTDAVDAIGSDHIREGWGCEIYPYDDIYFFRPGIRGVAERQRVAARAAIGRAVRLLRSVQAPSGGGELR